MFTITKILPNTPGSSKTPRTPIGEARIDKHQRASKRPIEMVYPQDVPGTLFKRRAITINPEPIVHIFPDTISEDLGLTPRNLHASSQIKPIIKLREINAECSSVTAHGYTEALVLTSSDPAPIEVPENTIVIKPVGKVSSNEEFEDYQHITVLLMQQNKRVSLQLELMHFPHLKALVFSEKNATIRDNHFISDFLEHVNLYQARDAEIGAMLGRLPQRLLQRKMGQRDKSSKPDSLDPDSVSCKI